MDCFDKIEGNTMVRLEKINGKNVWDAMRLSVKED